MSNKNRALESDSCGIALYNPIKKEPIAFFDRPSLASKYLFGESIKGAHKIVLATYRKGSVNTPLFPYKVAVRSLSPVQREVLESKEVLIFPGYPQISKEAVRGYYTTESHFQEAMKFKNRKA